MDLNESGILTLVLVVQLSLASSQIYPSWPIWCPLVSGQLAAVPPSAHLHEATLAALHGLKIMRSVVVQAPCCCHCPPCMHEVLQATSNEIDNPPLKRACH